MSPDPRSWAGSSGGPRALSEPLWTGTRARLSTGVRREVVRSRRAPVERCTRSLASWDISWVTRTCFRADTEAHTHTHTALD